MMTADEKNHVISNANEELDRQIVRLDTVFPYIAGEISEEARLGSLAHWAYSNKSTAKAATNERPRREAVNHRQDLAHALQEAEAASRSEARREAVLARKQRRANVDADYEDSRTARKNNTGRSRGDNATAEQSAATKRRKVERPAAADVSTPMERSASGTGSQRMSSKEGAEKKRSRAPNPHAAAARKKYVCPRCAVDLKLTVTQDQRCLQRWLPGVGTLPSYRNLQCAAGCRQPRAQPIASTIFSGSAEYGTGQQLETATVIVCLKPRQSANYLYVPLFLHS